MPDFLIYMGGGICVLWGLHHFLRYTIVAAIREANDEEEKKRQGVITPLPRGEEVLQ